MYKIDFLQTSLGRPRNTAADRRILQAALQLYGDTGWHGFNLTRVSNIANVGKSSMYNRWPEREELLFGAFQELIPTPKIIDTSIKEILAKEIDYRIHMYLGPYAKAARRVFSEVSTPGQPIIMQIYHHIYLDPIAAIRSQLWAFKTQGELPKQVSVTRLLDAIEGSVLMRAFCIPTEYIDCFLTEITEYAERLIEDQIRSYF